MKFEIEEEKKQDILKDFINTKKRIQTIADENKLSVEDVMLVLEEFNAKGIFDSRKYERLSPQIEEKIYELRKNDMSYEQISSELGICIEVIASVTKKIFEARKKEEPQDECSEKFLSKDEKIYNLRKQKKSYKEIADETGFSYKVAVKKCKGIFEFKKEEDPKAIENKLLEKIYNLRKQKKTYGEIAKETGLSEYKVVKVCREMFWGRGEEIPKASYKRKQTEESKEMDQIICDLVEEGKKYREVQDILYENGITMSEERIRQRNERGKYENKKKLANMILNLMITKKATLDQVKEMFDYYGLNLDETMNSIEER